MNVNRNLLSAAVASTLALSGAAHAVHLSETGTGQVLLFPYYSVRTADGGAYNTYIQLVNTTALPKAVKVRFREAKNSREVLDFNVYLSARDMWVGSVEPTTDGAKIVGGLDTSCTAPAIPAVGVEFRNYQYTNSTLGDLEDGAGTTLDRTREGYIEVIEMGVPAAVNIGPVVLGVNTAPTFAAAVTHGTNGIPANCAAVLAAWAGTDNAGTGSIFAGIAAELLPPSGGLAGSSVLINVASGAAYENEPTVLSGFENPAAVVGTHSYPGGATPQLTDAFAVSYSYGGTNLVLSSLWTNGADAVSSVLMRDSVMNEYSVNPAVNAKTDWIVTFPTKKDYVGDLGLNLLTGAANPQDNNADRPFTKNFVRGDVGACETVNMTSWDREEQSYTPAGGLDFSPQLPNGPTGTSLCWETNVLTFVPNGQLTGYKGVLGSAVQRGYELPAGANYNKGWAQLTFTDANASDNGAGVTLTATGLGAAPFNVATPYFGLPVIGHAVRSMVNGAVTAGVLANYGFSMAHKYTVDYVDTLPGAN